MKDAYVSYEESEVVVPATPFFRKLLRTMQVFPPEGEKHTIKHIVIFFIFQTYFTCPMVIGLFGFMHNSLQDGFKLELIECIDYIVHSIIYWLVLITVVVNSDEYVGFLSENETYRFGIPRSVRTKRKLYRIWGITFLIMVNLVVIIRAVMTHVIYCLQKKEYSSPQCKLGYTAWFPFKTDNVYIKNYIKMNGWMNAIFLGNLLSCYSLIPENVMVISARIRHLENLLARIRLQEDIYTNMKRLHFCIRYHNEIRRLICRLNSTIGFLLYPIFTVNIMMLSLLEYKILFEYEFMSVGLFLGWFSGPCMFCELGHVMNTEYEKLRWAVYDMKWYAMPSKLRKTYILLLGSVQKPIDFLVPPILPVNRVCLLRVMKGSYTFLMYLSNLR